MDDYFRANAILSKFSRNYMSLKKDLPVRPSEMGVLNILAETPGPHTALLLRDMLGVSKPMIAAHLSSLEKKGYITKTQSTDDKRIYFLTPTPKALALVEQVRKEMQAQLDAIAQGIGAQRFDQFVRLADEVNRIIEENTINTSKGKHGNGFE